MIAVLLALLAGSPGPQPAPAPAPAPVVSRRPAGQTPAEIVAAAPAAAWRRMAAADLLVMELAPDSAGKPRRIVIQLLPAPFSTGHVANVRALARAHWWDGTSINRVQDDYVAQWGDASERKPLPPGLEKVAQADYVADLGPARVDGAALRAGGGEAAFIGRVTTLARDPYADVTMIWRGWPVASGVRGAAADPRRTIAWPVHCYGMVGVGRDMAPDTGTGAELYAVIGHAPRHLDRNIALIGRVIEGIDHLSSLPRGTQPLGFYATAAERVPIVSVRLASELPAAQQPQFEYLATDSASFARYADARANRQDAFFIAPAGGADVCNVTVPIRRAVTPS